MLGAVLKWIYDHRGTVIALIAVLILSAMLAMLRLELSRIESLSSEIQELSDQNRRLTDELQQARLDTRAVAGYLSRIQRIENEYTMEVKRNEECIDRGDPDSFIDRLNELFGFCADPAEHP